MNNQETPMIDVAPKAIAAVILSRKIIARYLRPESNVTVGECMSELLEVLDDPKLVELLTKIESECEYKSVA